MKHNFWKCNNTPVSFIVWIIVSTVFKGTKLDLKDPLSLTVMHRGLTIESWTTKLPLWALCSWRSHGTNSAMLESKLSTETSRRKRLHQDKFAFSLFWMSQCIACSPAWRILYHVTASCKGPIAGRLHSKENRCPSCCLLSVLGCVQVFPNS